MVLYQKCFCANKRTSHIKARYIFALVHILISGVDFNIGFLTSALIGASFTLCCTLAYYAGVRKKGGAMADSFTDYISNIYEITGDNEFAKNELLNIFYKSPPENINKQIKKTLNDFFLSQNNKKLWLCGHEGCTDQSCNSHEISENIFLKHISDANSDVFILKRDMAKNSVFYTQGSINKRNASNFPGYCSQHDSDLFSDIEDKVPVLNLHFVNKQCLRSLRRKRFDIESHLRIAKQFIGTIEDDLKGFEEIQAVIGHFQNKIEILQTELSNIKSIYNEVLHGIDEQRYIIKYKEVDVKKDGYCFAQVLASTLEADSPCFLFLYKIDFGSEPKAFICWLDNEKSFKAFNDAQDDYKHYFTLFMYLHKEKLIFSKEFLNKLPQTVKEILYRDSEFYNLDPIQNCIISKYFF